jgi:co-chaperonin GroES (HSP10)
MTNNSGITPLGTTVLVLPEQVQRKTDSGIVLATESQADREQLGQTDGIVVAIASEAYQDRFKVGDRVIMTKYAGMIRVGNDGIEYRLVNDNEIKAVLAHKENDE